MTKQGDKKLKFARRGILTGAATALALSLGFSSLGTASQAETVLRVVPHAGLKILDPIWTTAYISRNHGYMIYDTLFSAGCEWRDSATDGRYRVSGPTMARP